MIDIPTSRKLGTVLAVGTLLCSGLANATSGVWTLTNNVTLTEDHGGTIVTNGFSVDCAGHYIYNASNEKVCAAGTRTCGISADHSSYSKVYNCHIEGYESGVYGEWGSAIEVKDSYIEYNSFGIDLRNWGSSPHTYIEDNYICNNASIGIVLTVADGQKILRNKIWNNGSNGAHVYYGRDNHFEGNDFWQNTGMGIYCYNSLDLDVWQNTVESNGMGNVKQDGIQSAACSGFDIWGNNVIDNGRIGVYVNGSSNGIVEANIGQGNLLYDAYQSSGSTNNVWLNNTWGKTYPSGLH